MVPGFLDIHFVMAGPSGWDLSPDHPVIAPPLLPLCSSPGRDDPLPLEGGKFTLRFAVGQPTDDDEPVPDADQGLLFFSSAVVCPVFL